MTFIKKLNIRNIRSHVDYSVSFDPAINLIVGKNGSGKTSIIEAIYLSLQGSSFKGSDQDMLNYKSSWWRIDLETDHDKRISTFNQSLTMKRKKISIDNKIMYRLASKYYYPIVLFEPDDLRLFNGAPLRRRQFIDRFIAQLDPLYMNSVRRYNQALKQRNSLLKQPLLSHDELFAWDVALSEYGSYIVNQRIKFINIINNKLNDEYKLIAKTNDNIEVSYSKKYGINVKQKIFNDLSSSKEKDQALGFTSVGPHRDDVIFSFNKHLALGVASRGEIRSIVLALKFMEVKIIEDLTKKNPLILLDDVFSDLDEERQKNLLTGKNQVIVTSVKRPSNISEDDINIIKLN
jgi:DNA replication and repair protein RecF